MIPIVVQRIVMVIGARSSPTLKTGSESSNLAPSTEHFAEPKY